MTVSIIKSRVLSLHMEEEMFSLVLKIFFVLYNSLPSPLLGVLREHAVFCDFFESSSFCFGKPT